MPQEKTHILIEGRKNTSFIFLRFDFNYAPVPLHSSFTTKNKQQKEYSEEQSDHFFPPCFPKVAKAISWLTIITLGMVIRSLWKKKIKAKPGKRSPEKF